MTLPTPTVLVVEDADEDFDTVEEAARRAGRSLNLVRATSGERCLEMLLGGNGQQLQPAPWLVMLDLNTPGLDGRDALAAMRHEARLLTLPIVVLSTSSNPQDVTLCYARGANAYHVKPVEYPQHLQVVQDIFDYWLTEKVLLPAAQREDWHL